MAGARLALGSTATRRYQNRLPLVIVGMAVIVAAVLAGRLLGARLLAPATAAQGAALPDHPVFGGTVGSKDLRSPLAVAVAPDGRVFVADSGGGRVLIFDRRGRRVGRLQGEFHYPNALAVGADGRVYVGEFAAERIQVFDAEGRLRQVLDEKTTGVPLQPLAIAADRQGDLYVADRSGRVLIFNSEGQLRQILGRPGTWQGLFAYPNGIAVDDGGRIIVSDSGNARLQVFTPSGRLERSLGAEELRVVMPRGIALGSDGRLYVADVLGHRIAVLDSNLNYLYSFGEPGTRAGQFLFPTSLAVHEGRLYVADRENNRVSFYVFAAARPGEGNG